MHVYRVCVGLPQSAFGPLSACHRPYIYIYIACATPSIAHDDDVCMMGESIEYLRMRLINQKDLINNNTEI